MERSPLGSTICYDMIVLLDRLMDNRAMIELMPLITEGTARMPSPFRIYPHAFFAILHSDEKQRFHLVIRLGQECLAQHRQSIRYALLHACGSEPRAYRTLE